MENIQIIQLPKIEDPNPYGAAEDMDQHQQWWDEHPDESDKFLHLIEQRNEVLRIMYVGARIGAGPWKIP